MNPNRLFHRQFDFRQGSPPYKRRPNLQSADLVEVLVKVLSRVNPFLSRLFICGYDERLRYKPHQISHIVSVANPTAPEWKPPWFKGEHIQLCFGDVASAIEARLYGTRASDTQDIQQALEFFRVAWRAKHSKILVTCDCGASRSPALAYLFVADQLGRSREFESFELTMQLRPNAVPNGLVVRLGDRFLKRDGELLKPLKEFYAKLNAELFKKPGQPH